jgi:pimeloyl-ACP methyl ester carboxylesterase
MPSEYGLKYEDVQFTSTVDNIALSGWLIDSPGDKVIIFMHGRNQTRDRDEAFLEKASILYNHNYDVLMFDFRGHGLSGGERYAMGAWETRDVAGAVAFLKGRGYSLIGTYGVSMGAAISLLAAPDQPDIKALMVDSPYGDLPHLLETKLPEASGLPAFFNPGIFFMSNLMYGLDVSNVKPADALAKLGDRPVLHVQSKDGDSEVPLTEGDTIRAAGASDPNFTSWAAPGKGHVSSYSNNKEEYTRRMLAFYDRYVK